MIVCGECRFNRRDWPDLTSQDYYCGNEESENYGCSTSYDDACDDGEPKSGNPGRWEEYWE